MIKHAQKRCNSNDTNPGCPQASGELHARLRWLAHLLCTSAEGMTKMRKTGPAPPPAVYPAPARTPGMRGYSCPHDERTTFRSGREAWASGGIHTPTMKEPPSMLIFLHQHAEKSLQTNTFFPSFKLAPTNFNTDFSALTSRKVATKPTRFVL